MALSRLRRQLSVAMRWARWSLHGAFGREVLDDRGGEGVMHEAVRVGHGGYLAGEIVAAGVQSGRFFAFPGPGTRGTLRVAAVGFELFFGDHLFNFYLDQSKTYEITDGVLSC